MVKGQSISCGFLMIFQTWGHSRRRPLQLPVRKKCDLLTVWSVDEPSQPPKPHQAPLYTFSMRNSVASPAALPKWTFTECSQKRKGCCFIYPASVGLESWENPRWKIANVSLSHRPFPSLHWVVTLVTWGPILIVNLFFLSLLTELRIQSNSQSWILLHVTRL